MWFRKMMAIFPLLPTLMSHATCRCVTILHERGCTWCGLWCTWNLRAIMCNITVIDAFNLRSIIKEMGNVSDICSIVSISLNIRTIVVICSLIYGLNWKCNGKLLHIYYWIIFEITYLFLNYFLNYFRIRGYKNQI